MSKADDLYEGLICAVCELPFEEGEGQFTVSATNERVHVCCWTDDGTCDHFPPELPPSPSSTHTSDGLPESTESAAENDSQ